MLPQLVTLKFETHVPPQSWKPVLHTTPQVVPSQLAVPLTGVGHGEHEVLPQLLVPLLLTHWFPQTCVPTLQAIAQVPAVQSRVALGGATGQTVQDAPQLSGSVFVAQMLPHWWYPDVQLMEHVPAAQIGEALMGALHTEQLDPQLDSFSATQLAPQRWKSVEQSQVCVASVQDSLGRKQSSTELSQPRVHCPVAPHQ